MDKSRSGKDRSVRQSRGHRERLREKFLKGGLAGFLDYEVIELLLTLGTPRKDCKQQAKDALMRFRSLRGVLEAPADELLRIKGIGPHNIFGLRLIQDVSRRFLKERMMSKPYCHSSIFFLHHSHEMENWKNYSLVFVKISLCLSS